MDFATSQSLSRLWRLALAGAFTAFAWIVLSLLLGLGPAQAQADDGDDDGLLGAVTSLVDETASTVTDTVSTVTTGVTETVNTVVAVAPAPVQQPVREVVKTVDDVVTTTTKPVTDAVSGGAVGAVTQPVVDVVKQVPVVGDVVTGVGLDDAVTDLGETVDRTLGEVAGAVTDVGTGLGETPTRPLPELPGIIPTAPALPAAPAAPAEPVLPVGGHLLPALDVALPAYAAVAGAQGAASDLSALLTAYEHRSVAVTGAVPTSAVPADTRGSSAPTGGLCPSASLSSGPGGAGSGAWALVALGPLVALRAWVRRAGPEDENAPPAPAALTDVSPD